MCIPCKRGSESSRVYGKHRQLAGYFTSRGNSVTLRLWTSTYFLASPCGCLLCLFLFFSFLVFSSFFFFFGQVYRVFGCKLFLARSVKFLLKYYEKFIQFSIVCPPSPSPPTALRHESSLKKKSLILRCFLWLVSFLSLSFSPSLSLFLCSCCCFLQLPLSRLTHSNLTFASLIQCAYLCLSLSLSLVVHLFPLHQWRLPRGMRLKRSGT